MIRDESERDPTEDYIKNHITIPQLTGTSIWDREVNDQSYLMVSGYSIRHLTFKRDKFPAISGLVGIVAKHRGDRYCAGMWWTDIGHDICWKVNRYKGSAPRPKQYIAASWSWTSVAGLVKFPATGANPSFKAPEPLHSVKYLNYGLQYRGQDIYGQLNGGWLRLQAHDAPLVKSTHNVSKAYHYRVGGIEDMDRASINFDIRGHE